MCVGLGGMAGGACRIGSQNESKQGVIAYLRDLEI